MSVLNTFSRDKYYIEYGPLVWRVAVYIGEDLKANESLNWKIKTNDGCARLLFLSLDPSTEYLSCMFPHLRIS